MDGEQSPVFLHFIILLMHAYAIHTGVHTLTFPPFSLHLKQPSRNSMPSTIFFFTSLGEAFALGGADLFSL